MSFNQYEIGNNNQSFQSDNNETKTPLLSIEIQLSENETATLSIMDDDVIEEKVEQFCKNHNLPSSVKKMITEQVMQQLESQINECME